MPTTKLNLPLISGNMSADVPRDMNALAQRIDDLAGVPGGHALLDENGNVIGVKDMIARNVRVEDPKNIFAGGNVEVVLEELFTNADNAQRALAGVIGAPTNPGDTFTKIRQDLQVQKTNLKNNLVKQRVSASENETLKSLVDKVGAIPPGRRSAYGVIEKDAKFEVRGLNFRPSILLWRSTTGDAAVISESIVRINTRPSADRGATFYADGFEADGAPGVITWQAIE